LFADVIEAYNGFNPSVQLGGPVEQGTLHFLHRDFQNLNSGKQVHDDIYWGGDFEKLTENASLRLLNESNYKFFIGYSGWSGGQLDDEIATRSWIVFKKSPIDIIFDTPIETMWADVLKKMGGRYKMFANYPIDPRLN
jgi:putative transcriptional regulator